MEHVLVVIKPDGMKRNLSGGVLTAMFAEELQVVVAKAVAVSQALAQEHYIHLKDEPFYQRLIDFLSGKFHGDQRLLAFVFSGEEAVARARRVAGATNPETADPGSIRGRFGRITTQGVYENVVHVSSDPDEAHREIQLWFGSEENVLS